MSGHYVQKRWDWKFLNRHNQLWTVSSWYISLYKIIIPRKFSESCWFCGGPSFQFHSFRNRNRSFSWQQYHFESHFEIQRMKSWMIGYDEQTPVLLIFETILLSTEWPVTISKRMKLKRRTTTKSAWFREIPWYYDFIKRDISRDIIYII